MTFKRGNTQFCLYWIMILFLHQSSVESLYQNVMAHCHHHRILEYIQYFKVQTNLNTLKMRIAFQSPNLNIMGETLDPFKVNGKPH